MGRPSGKRKSSGRGASGASRRKPTRPARDPIRLEVFHHLFAAAAEEMGAALQRSAFSPNVKERRDFSCALFDREGRMVSQAAHIPIHLGSIPLCVEACMRDLELGPGDTAIVNDPYRGGTHLPDVSLVTPVFLSGASRPDFYCANRAHHADVGGAYPGSMAPTFDVHGEGLRIPPTVLARGGEIDRGVLALLLANMRVPAEREGDLMAQWSANLLGERRLTAMAAEHGLGELRRRAGELMDWADELVGGLLEGLPRRTVRFEDVLERHPAGDSGATASDPGFAHVRVELTPVVSGGVARLEVDFTGSDDQLEHGVNATRAVALSAVFSVLRLLLPPGAPTNAGVLRRADVRTRPGSLVDARYPAPVAAGNVETSQRLVDVLLGAFAELVGARVPAASAGTMSNLTFGGTRPDGTDYTYYETIAGGAGASGSGPGSHALQTHMTNTRNTPIEALEASYPVRVVRSTVRRGSGGDGARPGGDGVERAFEFLAPARLAYVADRQRRGPYGLAGGAAARPGEARHVPAGGAAEDPGPKTGGKRARGGREAPGSTSLGGASTVSVRPGDRVEVATPGGGGHGRPARAKKRL